MAFIVTVLGINRVNPRDVQIVLRSKGIQLCAKDVSTKIAIMRNQIVRDYNLTGIDQIENWMYPKNSESDYQVIISKQIK